MIHVVAGAVTDAVGRILIAQRPPGKHLAGGWEFPGGKLEPGETRARGLARELREELGIAICEPRPLLRVHHAYPYGKVLIDMYVVTRYDGEPRGLDGQALRWCRPDELAVAELLPADRPIVRALRLPERLTQGSSADYVLRPPDGVVGSSDRDVGEPAGRLVGMVCATLEEGAAVAGGGGAGGGSGGGGGGGAGGGGADFLVLRCAVADIDLAGFCASLDLPVFARGITLERAWALGATGLDEV